MGIRQVTDRRSARGKPRPRMEVRPMRRAISLVVAAMLLALLVPVSAVSAKDSHRSGSGNGGKITVCHNVDHHAVTIRISMKAWPAHKRHGDTLGACVPLPVKPPKGTATVCTFDAATSAYYNGADQRDRAVCEPARSASRGPWRPAGRDDRRLLEQMMPLVAPVATYSNNVTGGSVSAGGAVSLSFVQTRCQLPVQLQRHPRRQRPHGVGHFATNTPATTSRRPAHVLHGQLDDGHRLHVQRADLGRLHRHDEHVGALRDGPDPLLVDRC